MTADNGWGFGTASSRFLELGFSYQGDFQRGDRGEHRDSFKESGRAVMGRDARVTREADGVEAAAGEYGHSLGQNQDGCGVQSSLRSCGAICGVINSCASSPTERHPARMASAHQDARRAHGTLHTEQARPGLKPWAEKPKRTQGARAGFPVDIRLLQNHVCTPARTDKPSGEKQLPQPLVAPNQPLVGAIHESPLRYCSPWL